MNLEDDLRQALKRTDAPPDFASRVIARVEREAAQSPRGGRIVAPTPVKHWLAAAATLTLVAWGGARYYEHQQNVAEARRVEAEIHLAMQITSEALARVQAKLQEHSR
jgi:hypothetical protein